MNEEPDEPTPVEYGSVIVSVSGALLKVITIVADGTGPVGLVPTMEPVLPLGEAEGGV